MTALCKGYVPIFTQCTDNHVHPVNHASFPKRLRTSLPQLNSRLNAEGLNQDRCLVFCPLLNTTPPQTHNITTESQKCTMSLLTAFSYHITSMQP